ncbi:hypothetical protein IFM89_009611 [Coptis chinensis]|uniref:RBR-type E3 ubiquitin transferase n=1 Tax=Coptis chinensis TaxID=261450 RepID=A0A835IZE3_9MAGN|nr:hypothetical protein IFM89_009611 [Coptis chinensis]
MKKGIKGSHQQRPLDEDNKTPHAQQDSSSKHNLNCCDSVRRPSRNNNSPKSKQIYRIIGLAHNNIQVVAQQEQEAVSSESEEEEVDDDVASRLEEQLRVSEQEPDLSEEQLRINDQLQEDELLAMEAIYGENLSILREEGGLRVFEIYIHIETPDELTISAKLLSSNGNAKLGMKSSSSLVTAECSNEFVYHFKVEHLPPIILRCLLPKSYPSHQPPYFTIAIQWLDSQRISNLCIMLDSLWTDQPGQEVIYQWVEWLQSSSLSYLGINKELVLGPLYMPHSGDRRAVSRSVSPEVDIPSMMNYNDDKCHEVFWQNMHECCICFGEHAGTEFIRLPCKHFYCWKCMEAYSSIHVKEGTINKLLCPDAKCGGMVPPGLLKHLLGDENYERWESLLLQKTLASMSDVIYCPRCETACLEDEDHNGQCSKCLYSFCSLCGDRRHVGSTCMSPELKLLLLQTKVSNFHFEPYLRQDGCELFPREEIQQWEERMNGRQLVGQIQAELYAAHGHSCPLCGQMNAKVGNNNHIFCWSCQNHYCYLCRKKVRRSSQHYGPKGCKQHTVG